MKPIGPIDTLQNLNLREGDWVVCVVQEGIYPHGHVFKYNNGIMAPNGTGPWQPQMSKFQRLHHHDPRPYGFEEKDRGGKLVSIFTELGGIYLGSTCGALCKWNVDGVALGNQFDVSGLIPITPPGLYTVTVSGGPFATREEAEAAIEIKEVT